MLEVAIVIPTSGNRMEYLTQSVDSILRQVGNFKVHILIGCPPEKHAFLKRAFDGCATVIAETPLEGLSAKIDDLLRRTPDSAKYISWLGDDDLLAPKSLEATIGALEDKPSGSLAYGGCDYIDSNGCLVARNPSGLWAAKILPFAPQLVPQPGSLFRREHFLLSGGLDHSLNLAFDFDLMLRLKQIGGLIFINRTLAQFRWHPTSLSVKRRLQSALEASQVRRSHYTGISKWLWFLWEPQVIMATWIAGKVITLRSKLA